LLEAANAAPAAPERMKLRRESTFVISGQALARIVIAWRVPP
jgi:hypothetical protein